VKKIGDVHVVGGVSMGRKRQVSAGPGVTIVRLAYSQTSTPSIVIENLAPTHVYPHFGTLGLNRHSYVEYDSFSPFPANFVVSSSAVGRSTLVIDLYYPNCLT